MATGMGIRHPSIMAMDMAIPLIPSLPMGTTRVLSITDDPTAVMGVMGTLTMHQGLRSATIRKR